MKNIVITGSSQIDTDNRFKAINTINNLSTTELTNLASLSSSKSARSYLSNNIKFNTLKSFL